MRCPRHLAADVLEQGWPQEKGAGLRSGRVGEIRMGQRKFHTRAVRSAKVVDEREFKPVLTSPSPIPLKLPRLAS